jgi:hypothetical protein
MSVRRDHEELVVITNTYDLILWSCNHTGKFPRRMSGGSVAGSVGCRKIMRQAVLPVRKSTSGS